MPPDDTAARLGEAATLVEGRAGRPSSACLDAEVVGELLEGTLADEPRERAEAHIDGCQRCRSLVASLATRLSLMLPSDRPETMAVSRYARATAATQQSGVQRKERSLEAGEQIDSYRIERLLGRGGMGEVYLAWDTKLDRQVAIKVVSMHLDTDNAMGRFMAEARTTARLNHPHVVTIHTVGEYDGMPYLALEYVKGQSLRRWLAKHAGGDLHEGLRLVLAIAEALVAAHRRSILHRDLKPENVLIDEDGRVRVVDFGLAVRFEVAPESVRRGSVSPGAFYTGIVGTPRYMAPEQWTDAEQGEGVDIWAVGVILYELVTGGLHPTGNSGTHQDSLLRLAAAAASPEPFALLPARIAVPERLRALIARCLDKDPAKRPRAHQVVAELSAVLATPKHRASPPNWLTVVGAVGALVLGGALWFVVDPAARAEPAPEQPSARGVVTPSATRPVASGSASAIPPATASPSGEPEEPAPTPSAPPPQPPLAASALPTRPLATATGSTPSGKDPLDKW